MKTLTPFSALLLVLPLISGFSAAQVHAQSTGNAGGRAIFSASSTASSAAGSDTAIDSEASSDSQVPTAPEFGALAAALPAAGGGGQTQAPAVVRHGMRPFSRIAVGAQISSLGPGGEIAVNLNRHMDARVTGNYFDYSTSFTEQGFDVNADAHLASAGASLDYYPFHNGFRLSPGIQVYNQNRVNAFGPVTPGESFQLNNQTFYAAYPNSALGITALSANGGLNLHKTRPGFTATTGWGSLIPRSGRHWAVPFEIGAVFSGTPKLSANLTGWACYDQAQTLCTNVADPSNPISVLIQGDLNSQIATWQNDINPLKVYPIISTGIVFNFNIR